MPCRGEENTTRKRYGASEWGNQNAKKYTKEVEERYTKEMKTRKQSEGGRQEEKREIEAKEKGLEVYKIRDILTEGKKVEENPCIEKKEWNRRAMWGRYCQRS